MDLLIISRDDIAARWENGKFTILESCCPQ
jgi:hypothetical protein